MSERERILQSLHESFCKLPGANCAMNEHTAPNAAYIQGYADCRRHIEEWFWREANEMPETEDSHASTTA